MKGIILFHIYLKLFIIIWVHLYKHIHKLSVLLNETQLDWHKSHRPSNNNPRISQLLFTTLQNTSKTIQVIDVSLSCLLGDKPWRNLVICTQGLWDWSLVWPEIFLLETSFHFIRIYYVSFQRMKISKSPTQVWHIWTRTTTMSKGSVVTFISWK